MADESTRSREEPQEKGDQFYKRALPRRGASFGRDRLLASLSLLLLSAPCAFIGHARLFPYVEVER